MCFPIMSLTQADEGNSAAHTPQDCLSERVKAILLCAHRAAAKEYSPRRKPWVLAANRPSRVAAEEGQHVNSVVDSLRVQLEWDRMSFILIPQQGEDLQVNAWNWRPTIALLRHANLIDVQQHELMGRNGCGGKVDSETATKIADFLDQYLAQLISGGWILQ